MAECNCKRLEEELARVREIATDWAENPGGYYSAARINCGQTILAALRGPRALGAEEASLATRECCACEGSGLSTLTNRQCTACRARPIKVDQPVTNVVAMNREQREIETLLREVIDTKPDSVVCVLLKEGKVTVTGSWRSRTELMGCLAGAQISVWCGDE